MLALTAAPLLMIDDLGLRELPPTPGEDLLELVMLRYEPACTPVYLESLLRGPGQATRRGGRCLAYVRPATTPRVSPEMRPAWLAHQEPR